MSLNNITLPAAAIADMYRTSIVELGANDVPSASAEKPHSSMRFLGKNQKQVTLLVNNPIDAFLSEPHLQFLTRILGACKLNLGDVAIVNTASKPVSADILTKEVQPCKLIMFGVSPEEIQLPFDFPLFKLQTHGPCTYLQAPAIEKLEGNTESAKALKAQLWSCLKQLFQV